jgi:hypothetical protein
MLRTWHISEMYYRILVKHDLLEDVDVNGRVILKLMRMWAEFF